MNESRFPDGWDGERVKSLIDHYEGMSDDEQAADDDTLAAVKEGIEQARRGEFVPGPDIDADAARFGGDEEFAADAD